MAANGRNWRYASLAAVLLPLSAIAGPPTFQASSDASRLYSQAARQAQYESLQRVAAADIEYGPFGRLRSIKGSTGIAVAGVSRLTEGGSAAAILESLKPMLMASSVDALRVRKLVHAFGEWTIFMDQSIDGIPVIDAGLNVRVNESGEVILVSSLFVPADASASRKPQLSAEVAISRLKEHLVASGLQEIAVSPANEARLAYWTDQGQEERARLVWRVHASHLSEGGSREEVDYCVDAASGEVVYLQRQAFGLNRTTYTLNYANNLNFSSYPSPLVLLWNEGSPNPNNLIANSIYTKSQTARDKWATIGLQHETFGLVANHPATYGAWTATNSAGALFSVFGDFMAGELDAVGHEYGHGVFIPLAGAPPMAPWDEYYPLNEFYGDLSGVMTEGGPPQGAATWQMTSNNVRNLANPKSVAGSDFQDWYPNKRSWGSSTAVGYSNSTIFGHALYLMVHGGTHVRAGQSDVGGPIPSYSITQTSAQTIFSIFGKALLDLTTAHTPLNGPNMRSATTNAANTLAGAAVATQVNLAWAAVGVGYGCSGPPATPSPTISPWYCRGTHDISWVQQSGVKYHGMVAPPGGIYELVGTTNIDIAASQCQADVTGTVKFRMRGCNACGCSNWTSDYYMYYYNPCL